MSIPSYRSWLSQTDGGAFSMRSSELRAVDEALLAYEKAGTPYGKEWTANELRIALEIWKFVKEHGVKLYSANVVVQHSISAAGGDRHAWDNMKGGVVDRSAKVAMGMIEKSLS